MWPVQVIELCVAVRTATYSAQRQRALAILELR